MGYRTLIKRPLDIIGDESASKRRCSPLEGTSSQASTMRRQYAMATADGLASKNDNGVPDHRPPQSQTRRPNNTEDPIYSRTDGQFDLMEGVEYTSGDRENDRHVICYGAVSIPFLNLVFIT